MVYFEKMKEIELFEMPVPETCTINWDTKKS